MRRVDYHGAVAVRVAAADADKISKALAAHKDVARVETLGKADGRVQLRAIARNGKSIATDVAAMLREKSLNVDELFVERGKLDDVFRELTTPDQRGK